MKNIKDLLANWQGNKVLMTIYPHPDDETMGAGGILMAAKKYGFKTIAVSLTSGSSGKVHINLKGKSLAETRTDEFTKAIKILGVNKGIIGPFTDAKLREEKNKWRPWLVKLLVEYKPEIVVTYDHSGNSGHPDHIVLSVVLKEIVKSLKIKPKILWTSLVDGIVKQKMVKDPVRDYAVNPDYYLEMKGGVIKKWLAAKAHKSQRLDKGLTLPMFILFVLLGHREWYHEVDLKKDYPYKFVEFKL